MRSDGAQIDAAIAAMLREFRDNPWFMDEFWPASRQRVRMIVNDVTAHAPPAGARQVLDIGCYNGFLSVILAELGYRVTASDAVRLDERRDLFAARGIEFMHANFNELDPFAGLPPGHFDGAVLGEVIEHVLNHPLGFISSIARVLKPGGLLVVTTPNPATLINAARVVRGTHSLWGTPTFIASPKIVDGRLIDDGGVHYREYLPRELRQLLEDGGFAVERLRYLGFGVNRTDPLLKRGLKRLLFQGDVRTHRLLGATQYVLAHRHSG